LVGRHMRHPLFGVVFPFRAQRHCVVIR
jgi:hypothetical protein